MVEVPGSSPVTPTIVVLGFSSHCDWHLVGKADRTAADYTKALTGLLTQHPWPTLSDVKVWIMATTSVVGLQNTLCFFKSDTR